VRDCAQALSSAERDYNALAADLQSQ